MRKRNNFDVKWSLIKILISLDSYRYCIVLTELFEILFTGARSYGNGWFNDARESHVKVDRVGKRMFNNVKFVLRREPFARSMQFCSRRPALCIPAWTANSRKAPFARTLQFISASVSMRKHVFPLFLPLCFPRAIVATSCIDERSIVCATVSIGYGRRKAGFSFSVTLHTATNRPRNLFVKGRHWMHTHLLKKL